MGIRVRKLQMTFPGTADPVLSIPALDVEKGQDVCLVGASGSGKTTLLNILAGITLPTSGSVSYGDTNICSLSEGRRDQFRAENIGYVFQTFNLLQSLTALENVLLAMRFGGLTGNEAQERATALIERVGLAHRSGARPGTLSVGEQQRVAIARALANKPRVVLADEPTANLDEVNGAEVITLLQEVTSHEQSSLVLVTHEERVRSAFHNIVVLSEVNA